MLRVHELFVTVNHDVAEKKKKLEEVDDSSRQCSGWSHADGGNWLLSAPAWVPARLLLCSCPAHAEASRLILSGNVAR
ncbi:hypothetical protein OUZ56_013187 [Daphnia magna]|uniref:Uncharacterized protein n=1 Tax=Daphnia magna TaxID=35525 RepID=A0ABQ9Z557_9CRUS|nr:hypothetical protein OUZ56_013187 [Daphnia magna]